MDAIALRAQDVSLDLFPSLYSITTYRVTSSNLYLRHTQVLLLRTGFITAHLGRYVDIYEASF